MSGWKTTRSASKKIKTNLPEENLEDIYLNKNYKAPIPKELETVYEEPKANRRGKSEILMTAKCFKRKIEFDEGFSRKKLMQRRAKMKRMSGTYCKKEVLSDEVFMKKMKELESEDEELVAESMDVDFKVLPDPVSYPEMKQVLSFDENCSLVSSSVKRKKLSFSDSINGIDEDIEVTTLDDAMSSHPPLNGENRDRAKRKPASKAKKRRDSLIVLNARRLIRKIEEDEELELSESPSDSMLQGFDSINLE